VRLPTFNAKSFALFCVGVLCLTIAGVSLNLWWNARITFQRTNATLENLRETSGEVKEFVSERRDEFTDNKRSIDAGLQLAATAKGSVQLINRTTIPALTEGAKALTGSANELTAFIASLKADSQRSFSRINDDLLPGIVGVTGESKAALQAITRLENELTEAVKDGRLTVQQATRILADPNIPLIFSRLADGSLEFKDFAAMVKVEGKQALANFSELLDLWSKYTATANKYSKWVYLARIIGLLGGLPRP
jgi:hypothetical protein